MTGKEFLAFQQLKEVLIESANRCIKDATSTPNETDKISLGGVADGFRLAADRLGKLLIALNK